MAPDPRPATLEVQLLRAAQGGDRQAFGTLVLDASPMLERLALKLLTHREDAEDAVQETVLQAWRVLPGFRGQARFRTWMYRILVSRSIDLLRRRRPTVELPAVAARASVDPAAGAEARDLERSARAAIEELPPAQRATLLLRTDQGLSYDEIAYVLGTTRNAVRANLVAARKRLATRLRPFLRREGRDA